MSSATARRSITGAITARSGSTTPSRTRKIGFATFWPGYLGTLDLTSRDGAHKFSIGVYSQITKDGKPYTIDWNDPGQVRQRDQRDLRRARPSRSRRACPPIRTAAAAAAASMGTSATWPICRARARYGSLGRQLRTRRSRPPAPSPALICISRRRCRSRSRRRSSSSTKRARSRTPASSEQARAACDVKLGLTFSDFLTNCVKNERRRGRRHDRVQQARRRHLARRRALSFDVAGVDLNFSDETPRPRTTSFTTRTPAADDVATRVRRRSVPLGKIANDHVGNDGTAARGPSRRRSRVSRVRAVVQDALNGFIPAGPQYQLGEPEVHDRRSTAANPGLSPPAAPASRASSPRRPVTGNAQMDVLALGPTPRSSTQTLALGLKPGHPEVDFCLDTTGDV